MDSVVWVSANEIIAAQTKEIEREFKTSRPKPRNRAMGFKGRDPKPELSVALKSLRIAQQAFEWNSSVENAQILYELRKSVRQISDL